MIAQNISFADVEYYITVIINEIILNYKILSV